MLCRATTPDSPLFLPFVALTGHGLHRKDTLAVREYNFRDKAGLM